MLFQHGIGRDEFRVFHHFVFGDGPAVIIPGIPAVFRRGGKIIFDLCIVRAVFLHDLQSVAALDRDLIELEMPGRIEVDQFEIDPPAGHFSALAGRAEQVVVMLDQRRSHDDRLAAPGQSARMPSFEIPRFRQRQFRRQRTPHFLPAEICMAGFTFRDQQRREDHIFGQFSGQVKRTLDPDPVREPDDLQIQHAELQFRGKTVFRSFLPVQFQLFSIGINFRTARRTEIEPADPEPCKW